MRGHKSIKEYEEKIDLVEEYLIQFKELKKVGSLLGLSSSTVSKIAKEKGLRHLVDKGASIPNPLSEDEKELAYISGIIAADGCLVSGKEAISFYLVEEDYTTVEWMVSKLSKNKSPRYKKKKLEAILPEKNGKTYFSKQAQVGFNLSNPYYYSYLLELGLTPNKTHSLNVNLEGKTDEFLLYFLRGVIDGDGCVYVSPDEFLTTSSIQICGASKEFLLTLQKYFGGSIGLTTKAKDSRSNVWTLFISGVGAQSLAKILPKESYMISRKTTKLGELLTKKIRYIKPGSVLKGILWNNSTKFPQPKSWKMLYAEIENPIVSLNQVKHRIFDYGWTIEQALYTPPGSIENRGKYSTKSKKY